MLSSKIDIVHLPAVLVCMPRETVSAERTHPHQLPEAVVRFAVKLLEAYAMAPEGSRGRRAGRAARTVIQSAPGPAYQWLSGGG